MFSDEPKPVSLSFAIQKPPKRQNIEVPVVKQKEKPQRKEQETVEERTVAIPKEFKKLAKSFGLPEEHLEFFYENRASFNWECKDKTQIKCAEQHCKFETKGFEGCLNDHMISVHNYKDIRCDHVDCSFIAFSQKNLNHHKSKFHGHGKKPTEFGFNSCPYSSCKASFRFPAQLRNHLDIHENRIFSCNFCLYRCAERKSITDHLYLHFNIRKFLCQICSRAFHSQYCLTSHVKSIHSKEDFECIHCGFTAPKRSAFDKHRASCEKRLKHSRIL